jgi:hypothetical protein
MCDFCSEPNVAWRYPAQNFIAYAGPSIVRRSVGDWAACSICHRLLEADDRCGLLERSSQMLLGKHPEMREAEAELRDQIAGFHRMFFEHRLGPAVAIV